MKKAVEMKGLKSMESSQSEEVKCFIAVLINFMKSKLSLMKQGFLYDLYFFHLFYPESSKSRVTPSKISNSVSFF